jgi:cAMP-dependent protein kinase regulator
MAPQAAADKIEDYIKVKEVDKIFRSVLVQCFRARPENPAGFVLDYMLEQYPEEAAKRSVGLQPAAASSTEGEGGFSVAVHHENAECDDYLNNQLDIASLITHICQELLEARPEDPLDHMVKLLLNVKQLHGFPGYEDPDYSTDGGNVAVAGEDMYEDFTRRTSITGRRSSVSAECTDMATLGQTIVQPRVIEKSAEEASEIMLALQQNILFKDLDYNLKEQIVGAMFPMDFTAGTTIIKQGDEGDNLYLLREGEAMVFMQTGDEVPAHLITYGKLATFGELALMYGNVRAATVKAKCDVKTWALDRVTFRHVVYTNMTARREAHQAFLTNVPVLNLLSEQQQSLVADILQTVKFQAGESIITQGDHGDHFYILEEGECAVFFDLEDGTQLPVRTYDTVGDYFGELAFLTSSPRAATVVANTSVTCLAMDKSSFKRLLGPCETYLRDNMVAYKQMFGPYSAPKNSNLRQTL